MHQATDKNRGAKILSYKQLKHEFDVASLLFRGKETDSNWEVRQAFFAKVKLFLLSDDANTCKDELVAKLHETIPGIYNTIKSIRTTLIEEALSLVEAIGICVGESINMHTNEAILKFLMNESCVTKKATATRAFEATNNYLTNIKFRPKVLTFLCARAQEKNPQLREYAFGYIKTVLSIHGPANSSRIENADLTQAVADALQKGLVDAAPTVRTACRATYYVFEQYWPTAALKLASKLDMVLQRRLGVDIERVASVLNNSTKPFLRRTSKSSAGAIKKPVSSVSSAKTASSNIRTTMKLSSSFTSNATSSIASKPLSYGFNLSKQHRTEAEPVQSTSITGTDPQESSPKSREVSPKPELGELPSMPSTSSSEELPPMPSTSNLEDLSSIPSTSNLEELPSRPQELPSNSQILSPNSNSQELSPNPNSQELSSKFISHELSFSIASQKLLSDSNSGDLSSNLTELSSIAVENIPHPLDTQAHRKSDIMSSPTVSTSNKRSKSPLHYTEKSSASAIKKSVGRNSLSQTARLVKNSRSAMSPISNTELPARSSSVLTKTSSVSTVKQPRQLDIATQRRLGLLPAEPDTSAGKRSNSMSSATSLTGNKGTRPSLQYTNKSSAGTIKKPISKNSISKTARLFQKSHSVMSPTSNTESSTHSSKTSPAESVSSTQSSHTSTGKRSDVIPSPTPSTSSKSSRTAIHRTIKSSSSSIQKPVSNTNGIRSSRPKLRKSTNLSHKYDHIKSRYKDIPATHK